ncbi:MAG: Bug family tripartite tricarboxylate transporter substrate binding protein, partial [Sulfurifustis sp.]
MRKITTSLALIAFAVMFAGESAHAEDAYPSKPIKILVPFTPGTGIDILARVLGQRMNETWKAPVVVENRPGASGNIGTEAAARSPADGYTLLMTANTIVLNRSLFKRIPYDPIKDFEPVAPLAIGSLALAVHPSVNAKTAKELIDLAKKNPGKLNYGSPGNGTPHHLAMELFKQRAGIDLTHVPYKGSGGAVQDLLGGQIQVMFLPIHVALPLIETHKLNLLAAGGTKRSAVTPDVPSLAEATGIGDIDVDIWYALYVPAGTPKSIVEKLSSTTNALLKNPEVKES